MVSALNRHEIATFASPLIAKLATRAPLSPEDQNALYDLYTDAREMAAPQHHREGDRPDHIHLIIDGWAARYKLLPDGARQITASASRSGSRRPLRNKLVRRGGAPLARAERRAPWQGLVFMICSNLAH